jgi:serine/threonine protein kinase
MSGEWTARSVQDDYGLEDANGELLSPAMTGQILSDLDGTIDLPAGKVIRSPASARVMYYSARERRTQQEVSLRRRTHTSSEMPGAWVREVTALRVLDSPHVLELIDFCIHPTEGGGAHFTLVFPRFDCMLETELSQCKDHKTLLPRQKVWTYSANLINGLAHIHEMGFLHRSLHTNGLVVRNGQLQIAGFSVVRPYEFDSSEPYTVDVGMYWCQAPEIMLCATSYSTKVDIWSAACIIGRMLLTKDLFHGDSQVHCLFLIFQLLGTPTELEWPGLADLYGYSSKWPKWEVSPDRVKHQLLRRAQQPEGVEPPGCGAGC